MQDIKDDMEGGLKSFILGQQEEDSDKAVLSLFQFDTEYEKVYENVDVKDVPEYKLIPRGGTALLDGIGRTINAIGERLDKATEKPDNVVIVIITDGEENSSREFTIDKVKELIKHQEDKYSWSFVYIGAQQDAIEVGGSLGISAGSSLTYGKGSTANMWKAASGQMRSFRTGNAYATANGLEKMSYLFNEEDRTESI